DGWVRVWLPDVPQPTPGWVRAFDVVVTSVAFRIRVALAQHRITVFDRRRVIYRGPIDVDAAERASTQAGDYYARRFVASRRSRTTTSPYVYDLIAPLAARLPLGTPVQIT